MIAKAKSPTIVAETVGRDAASFAALQQLAEAYAIPVFGARSSVTYASFPTSNKLYQGFYTHEQLAGSDLILLVGGRAPWYPPSRRPGCGQIVPMATTRSSATSPTRCCSPTATSKATWPRR